MPGSLTIADAAVAIVADWAKFKQSIDTGFAQAEARAKTAGQRVTQAFSPQNLSRALTGVGAAGGALFAGAIGGAANFEDQLRTINTVAKLPEETLKGIGDEIIALSGETGKSTDDLTSGFYDLVSAGVPAGEAISVLRDSAKFATGALGTTAESVDLVTSAMNAYGLKAGDSTRITDIFAKAVADGKVTASELGSSIAQIAPLAASAGVSLEEVSAGYALLTAKGVPAAEAATQMKAAISSLLSPNEALNKIQKQTGINFAELAKEKGLAVALEELRVATGGNAEAMTKALGSIDAYKFALATTGDNAAVMAEQIVETAGATGLAQDQYDEKSKSAVEQGKRLAASIRGTALTIGGPFVDSLGAGVIALNEIGGGMGGLVNLSRLVGGGLGALAGKALPLLMTGLTGLIPAITPILTSIGAAIPTIISVAMAAWPLLLLAAVVAGIIFLVNNPEIVAKIGEFIGGVLTAIGTFLGQLPSILLNVFTGALGLVAQHLPGLVLNLAKIILSLPFRILGLQVKLLEFFASIGTNILGGIAQLIANIVGFFVKLPGRIVSMAPAIIAQFGALASALVAKVSGFIASIVDFFLKIPGRIAKVGGEIVSGIIRGMASLPGKLVDTVANAFRRIKIDIGPFHISANGVSIDLPRIELPSFDVGSNFIPADMLAMVHRGEIIVPADEAADIRAGRKTLGSGQGAPAGGDTYITNNNNVQVEGLVKARDSFEIATQLRRLTDFGILTSPRPDGA